MTETEQSTTGFLVLSDRVAQDTRLSFRARGVLISILSRPDNWSISADKLASEGNERRDAILTAFKELRKAGYMKVTKTRGDKGRIITRVYVFDSPEPATE